MKQRTEDGGERRRGPWPELLLLAGSLLVSLLLAEVAARVFYAATYAGTLRDLSEDLPPPGQVATLGDMLRVSEHPRLVYQMKPGLDVVFQGAAVRTNSAGWREDEMPLEKDGGTIRIVALGDSVMFGHGIEVGERYSDVLEALLNRRLPQARWEVVNLAVPGYNLVMEVESLKAYGLAYEPDLVLYGYVANDYCLPNFVASPLDVLGTGSFLVRYLSGGTGVGLTHRNQVLSHPLAPTYNLETRGYEKVFETYCVPENVAPEYRHLVGAESFSAALSELAAIGRERRIPIAFLRYTENRRSPTVPKVDGIVYLDLTGPLEEVLVRKGVRRMRKSDLVLSDGDPHPSAAGHRVIAKLLLERMIRHGMTGKLLARRKP